MAGRQVAEQALEPAHSRVPERAQYPPIPRQALVRVQVLVQAQALVQALPLALLAVFLLPALAYAGGAAIWQLVQAVRSGNDPRMRA